MDPDIVILFLAYTILGIIIITGLIWLAKKVWNTNWHISVKLLLLAGLLVIFPVLLTYVLGPVSEFIDKLNLLGRCC